MNKCFDAYSLYYDLLYKDKDYSGEVAYIDSLIKQYSKASKTVLELGCGTGRHAQALHKIGYTVHGIDLSQGMVEKANEKACDGLSFHQGDVRDYRVDEKFDSVISLFHVASYQTSNEDLKSFIKTAHHHLNAEGVFIFDFWYGPAVLSDKPKISIKRLEDDKISVTRIGEPVFKENNNVVDVNYELLIKNKSTLKYDKVQETHSMRYIFIPELQLIFKEVGFELVDSLAWLSDQKLSLNNWNGLVVARKK